jgi:hypothetical protein
MATKKITTDEPFGKVDPEQLAVASAPLAPAPIPVAVEVDAPPAAEDSSRKGKVDEKFKDVIWYLTALRDSYHDGEIQSNFNQAITAARTAHLWALEALRKAI